MFFFFIGLVGIAQQLNGKGGRLEPFPPGTFEEYALAADGTAKFIRRQSFHKPGDRPSFTPFILYEGKGSVFLNKYHYLVKIRTIKNY